MESTGTADTYSITVIGGIPSGTEDQQSAGAQFKQLVATEQRDHSRQPVPGPPLRGEPDSAGKERAPAAAESVPGTADRSAAARQRAHVRPHPGAAVLADRRQRLPDLGAGTGVQLRPWDLGQGGN